MQKNSLSNGGILRVDHLTKTKGFAQHTEFLGFSSWYSLLTFAHIPVLILKPLEQYSELNSLSNGGILRVDHLTKTKGFVQHTKFLGKTKGFAQLVFTADIRSYTCVDSETT